MTRLGGMNYPDPLEAVKDGTITRVEPIAKLEADGSGYSVRLGLSAIRKVTRKVPHRKTPRVGETPEIYGGRTERHLKREDAIEAAMEIARHVVLPAPVASGRRALIAAVRKLRDDEA